LAEKREAVDNRRDELKKSRPVLRDRETPEENQGSQRRKRMAQEKQNANAAPQVTASPQGEPCILTSNQGKVIVS